MGLRYRKSITIFPGVKLNISKSGLSLSVGKKGAHVTAGTSGKKSVSVGVPGTGLSYTKNLKKGKGINFGPLFTAVVIGGAIIAGIFMYKDKISDSVKSFIRHEKTESATIEADGNDNADETKGYFVNSTTKKYHKADCRYSKAENAKPVNTSKDKLEKDGYEACKICNP